MKETSELFFFVMLIPLEEREKHLDFKVFETLHFLPAVHHDGLWQAGVQGDNWRDYSEVSENKKSGSIINETAYI